MHNPCNMLESSPNYPSLPWPVEKSSSMKLGLGAKKGWEPLGVSDLFGGILLFGQSQHITSPPKSFPSCM